MKNEAWLIFRLRRRNRKWLDKLDTQKRICDGTRLLWRRETWNQKNATKDILYTKNENKKQKKTGVLSKEMKMVKI